MALRCDLWPSTLTFSVHQGHLHSIFWCIKCCWMLVLSMEVVGSIEIESQWRHNLFESLNINLIKFKYKSTRNFLVMISDVSNFISISLHKHRSEIHCRRAKREIWWKSQNCIIMTLRRWPQVTNFYRARASVVSNNVGEKALPNKCIHFA